MSDEGVGIPVEELDAVFEKFVQSSRTRTGAGGTGLGLALVNDIARLHRSHLQLSRSESLGGLHPVTRTLERIEQLCEIPVDIVSTGPDRVHTINKSKTLLLA